MYKTREDLPRAHAEQRLNNRSETGPAPNARLAEDLLHELQVHQIELEMQNEELRHAQQIFEESRDSYQELYDFAPIGYLSLDRSGAIVEINLTGAEMFGRPRKQLLKLAFSSLVCRQDNDLWFSHFLELMKQGEKQRCELALKHADGSQFHARLDCLRMERDGAAPVARIAMTDITERWLARQHLVGVVQAAMDAMISIDEHQRIVLFNPAAERMFGLPAAKALGAPLDQFLPASPCATEAQQMHAVFRADSANNPEERVGMLARRANGELFPIEATTSQVEAQGRRLSTVILRELTGRMRIERALRESQADLNRAQAVGQIGSWRLNLQHNELIWSDENHRIFGIAKGKPLTYEVFLSAIHPDDRQYVERMWQAALHGTPYDIEHRLIVDGAIKWVRERAQIEFAADGQVLAGFGTTQDITELKLAEQALIEADSRKDEFLAMLSHELRNPLTPIRNAAHILGRLDTQEPKVLWAKDVIERQVVHLTRLVDDLLDVSRIVRGKVELQPQSLLLADAVHRAVEMAQPMIESKQHQFELQLPEQPIWLRGDPVRLTQVLHNLLDNAVKYTPDGGRIELLARVAGRMIEIRLRDNGIGIPVELQPRIFDAFQQGTRALDRAQGGLGIGLTLAKRLVHLHGGLIEVYSAGQGLGSEFTITLPNRVDAAAAEPASEAAANASTAADGCRVLVVDDDPDIVDSMTTLLRIEGHVVSTAGDGETALELARKFHPRLVLLDIGLQGMDGYEVARRLRAQQADEKLTLVAVTGYGHAEARSATEAAGFDRHLVKPVYPAALCELLAQIAGSTPLTAN